jgi:hypothetical protein
LYFLKRTFAEKNPVLIFLQVLEPDSFHALE